MNKYNKIKQEFLLSFFTEIEYQEKQVNGFWLIKNWNGNTNNWQVSIFPEESFKKYKTAQTQFKELKEQENHLESI